MLNFHIDYHWGYLIFGGLLVFTLSVMFSILKWKAEGFDNLLKGFLIGILGFVSLFTIVALFHIPEMIW